MPWHIPEDLEHFKKTTLNHTVIMGNKTYHSIGKALSGRFNIVLSRNPDTQHEGVLVCPDLHSAIKSATTDHVFIIGGASVFEVALPLVDNLYVTKIDHAFLGDTFFPEIDRELWYEVSSTKMISISGYSLVFVVYSKRIDKLK